MPLRHVHSRMPITWQEHDLDKSIYKNFGLNTGFIKWQCMIAQLIDKHSAVFYWFSCHQNSIIDTVLPIDEVTTTHLDYTLGHQILVTYSNNRSCSVRWNLTYTNEPHVVWESHVIEKSIPVIHCFSLKVKYTVVKVVTRTVPCIFTKKPVSCFCRDEHNVHGHAWSSF